MTWRGTSIAVFLAGAFLASPAGSQSVTVPLAVTPQPPTRMAIESGRSDGVADALNAAIQRSDPGIVFTRSSASVQRVLELARAGQNVCANYLIRTPERDEIFVFSSATITVALNRLMVRRDAAAQIRRTPDGAADLATALADGLRIAVTRGRTYGASIDPILTDPKNRTLTVTSNDQIFELAKANRVDMFIGLPHEAIYQQQVNGLPKEAFQSFTLPGQQTGDIPNYVCSKNAWGRQIIARLDAAHDRHVRDAHYTAFFRWLDPESRRIVREELARKGEPAVPEPPEG